MTSFACRINWPIWMWVSRAVLSFREKYYIREAVAWLIYQIHRKIQRYDISNETELKHGTNENKNMKQIDFLLQNALPIHIITSLRILFKFPFVPAIGVVMRRQMKIKTIRRKNVYDFFICHIKLFFSLSRWFGLFYVVLCLCQW